MPSGQLPEPDLFHPPETLADRMRDLLISKFRGIENDPAAAHLKELRDRCRNGNPFPLIAAQWPELIVSDPQDARFFKGRVGSDSDPCLRLDYWQRRILRHFYLDSVSEIFIKGNTKAGKGTAASIGINLWLDVWPECKVILTSQRYDHAVKVIFGEVSAWRQKMAFPGEGRLTSEGISYGKQRYLTIANPQSGEGFSGQHGPRTLFVFDEATSAPDPFYDDAQKQARKIVALANPRTLFGWFRSGYSGCADENTSQVINGPFGRRYCVTVDGADCLNVREKRLEKPLGPPGGIEIDGQQFEHNDTIPPEQYESVKTLIPNQCDYGRFLGICQHKDPRHVAVFAHGHFPTEDEEKQVILSSWLRRHEEAYEQQRPEVDCFGLDVARSLGGDATVLTAGGLGGMRDIHRWSYNDTTFHASEVVRIARVRHGINLLLGQNPVCVDMDGLGAGVGDQLSAQGVWVIEFRGNSGSIVDPRLYANLRAEGYGTLGRRFNPQESWPDPWSIPTDTALRQELTAPEKVYSADGLRFHITPKTRKPGMNDRIHTVHDKIGRSPDTGDSTVYLWHAVREYHGLNGYFTHYDGDLTMWPEPEHVDRERQDRTSPIRDLNTSATDDEPTPAAAHPSPPDESDLVAWLRGERPECYDEYSPDDDAEPEIEVGDLYKDL